MDRHSAPTNNRLLKIILGIGIPVVIIAFAVVFCFVINEWTINLDIGDSVVNTEYGDIPILDEGSATLTCSILKFVNIAVPVEVEGEQEFYNIGEYTITYTARYFGLSETKEKILIVSDTTPPVISLTPDEKDYVLPNETYKEAGYKAVDNRDGDITDKVVREDKYSKIVYTVSDESGNETVEERKITRKDPIPPELTLEGDLEIITDTLSGYSEPGYTAVDQVDGDVTDLVTIETDMDASVAGDYTITYIAKDKSGNETRAERKVTVQSILDKYSTLPDVLPEKNGCTIYLTFDDGPSSATRDLLDVLDKYGVKATFFVTNYGDSSIIAEEAARGHSIGVHTYSHKYDVIYQSEEAFFADFDQMNQVIYEQTGSYTTLMRFPGGSSNTVSRDYCSGLMTRLVQAVNERGYTYFDWNVESGDADGTTSTEGVFINVINGCSGKTNSIVLQHDSYGYSTRAVEYIIIWGLSNGYTFAPLTSSSPTAHHGVYN